MKIVLIIIALVLLKYVFHFDLIEYLKGPQAQKVIGPIWNAIKAFYDWLDTLVRNWVT